MNKTPIQKATEQAAQGAVADAAILCRRILAANPATRTLCSNAETP